MPRNEDLAPGVDLFANQGVDGRSIVSEPKPRPNMFNRTTPAAAHGSRRKAGSLTRRAPGRRALPSLLLLLLLLAVRPAAAQPEDPPVPDVPEQIEVTPAAADEEIETRLMRILEATDWFESAEVRVDEGVAFLEGFALNADRREWAGRLAGNTEGVVAVVNRIQVRERSMWDLSPAWGELRGLWDRSIQQSPLILMAVLLLIATWYATKWSVRGAGALLERRFRSQLLREVVARAVAIPVFLLGLYLVLKMAGLTRLALTVLGGTGLAGLIIGFAFRDIAENFLASILLSIQRPFARGDLVSVAGHKGYVQSVNTRSTLLMTLEGNHVQIPNATIYKETITNFTSNPNERFEFTVGIGFDDSISAAQSVILEVLQKHAAVLKDPEPLVLVENLGASTVNLRVYFWLNITVNSGLKVESSLIRLTKNALQNAGISMPDDAREVIFPQGVPIREMSKDQRDRIAPAPAPAPRKTDGPAPAPATEAEAHRAEGSLISEAGEIRAQAQQARAPEEGENLLET